MIKKRSLVFISLCIIVLCTLLIPQIASTTRTEYDYPVPHIYQLNYKPIGWSCCGPASITMLLRYHFPNSEIDVPEVYHSGTQGYTYHGPAIGYKSVSFAEADHGSPEDINKAFKNYYHGDYSGMSSGVAIHFLNLIWGGKAEVKDVPILEVINEIKKRPLILNVWYYWYDKQGKEQKSGHYVMLRGYDDKGTLELEDDLFHVNDPAKNEPIYWNYKEFSRRRYKGRIITFKPTLSKNQREYTVVIDNNHVQLDDISAKDADGNYIWLEYYGLRDEYHHGDWYYPKEKGHWAKWVPNLPLNGSYEVHVIFRKDKEQGNVNYTIYDPDGIEIDNKTINQEGIGWSDENLGTFSFKKGSYVQVDDMPAKCNADAIRFEYILSLCIITPTQASPASAGDHENPHHIGVKVEVKEGTTPITCLANADFSFKIDEKSAVASLIDTSISGEYVFDITPPKQDAAGKYDLEVIATYKETSSKDTEQEAVIYTSLEAKPVLISPLRITPEKNKYYVGDTLRAEFTIKNIGGAPITLDKLLVGGRFNDAKLPNGEYPDFTSQTTTLQLDDQYRYNGTLTPTQPGDYHFFIAYYIENPTSEEKKLLDENNWNTCVGLGEGLTDADRIENIRVFPQLEKNVLYVPDGYPTIQTAVNAASAGDTIIVKDGIYYENVDVTKSLTIRSTSGNPANMIVQAKYPDDHVFYLTADNVNISGFTIKGATGHYLRESKGSGYCGLDLYKAKYCNIFDIIACENHFGIFLSSGSNKNTLTGNEVFNNTNCGIAVYSSSNNNLINNNALSNKYGIAIYTPASSNNTLINNNAFYNYYGIYLGDSSNNKIYLNSFIDNSNNVYSYSSTNIWNSKEKITYIYRGNTYTSYLGNYWSDYVGYDADNNGIGDSHYPIENDKDKYPLMTVSGRYFNPSPTIPTPQTSTLTPTPRPTLTPTGRAC